MKFRHTILILCLMVAICGCSFLPKLSFNHSNNLPQSTEKSQKNVRCEGELKIQDGTISCTKGFYSNENLFNQVERKTTLKEKILNFFSGLVGWGFWIAILLLILCPGILGWLIGRVFNIFKSGLSSTVSAISSFKDKAKVSNDPSYKKAADDLIAELSSAHQEAGVEKLINTVRTKIS